MPSAAYSGTVKASKAASTAFSNEATTKLTANTVYQITDSVKRIIDPNVNAVVEVDADGAGGGGYVVAAAETYTLNYLQGKITFASDQGVNALVRISGSYFELVPVIEVFDTSVTLTATNEEKTTLDDSGWKTRKQTLKDFSVEIKSYALTNVDLDPGAGVVKFEALYESGAGLLIELVAAGATLRGWCKVEETSEAIPVSGLYQGTTKLVGSAVPGAGQTEVAAFEVF